MSASLTKEQVEDLLEYLGSAEIRGWKGNRIQACCPVHGESHPSFGINIDFCPEDKPNAHYQTCHCFSCGFSGSIPYLVYKSQPDEFRSIKAAEQWLKDRYGVSYNYHFDEETGTFITRYEDKYEEKPEKRFVLPRTKLAPFMSGKETYQYFFDRGFDKADMKKFMIGRDLTSETVTIPAFWDDGELAGIIGRYIDPDRPKNSRFRIYDFPKGMLVYPFNYLKAVDGVIIGIESMLDAIMMHKWGFPNACAMMGDGMSKQQADIIASRCNKFIPLFDLDKGGDIAVSIAKKRLGKRVMILEPTYFPKKGKDPCEWGEKETIKIINSAQFIGRKSLPRLY